MRLSLFGGLDLLRLVQAPPVLTGAGAEQLGDLCAALAETAETTELSALSRVARFRSLSYQMVEAILAEVNWSATLLAEYQSLGRVLPALLFIQKHLAEPFTRDDLARELRLSAAQFHVVFKRPWGWRRWST